MKRRGLIAIVLFVFVVVGVIIVAGARRVNAPNTFQAAFPPGGQVSMDLTAGGYEVRGTSDSQIKVECNSFDLSEVHSDINVSGASARVQVSGPSNDFRAVIYVPQRTDLDVNQSVGELRVRNVEGNKDVDLGIGNLSIEIPRKEDYRSVETSVSIGDNSASPWHIGKGGFLRTIYTSGQGKYKLSAHVSIGKVSLEQGWSR